MMWQRALEAAAVLLPAVLSAQTVRGSVVDRAQRPVAGVVVLLLDSADRSAARALTNDRGAYNLTAPAPGIFRLKTLRIGYRPAISAPMTLQIGQDATLQLTVTDVPTALETIRVTGRNACRVRPDSAFATFAVWEEIRTALMAAELSAAARNVITRVVSYERRLDPKTGRLLREKRALSTSTGAQPWTSVSADSLRRVGYAVIGDDGAMTFYAPDLAVLLSDIFVEDHCVRLAPAADSKRIGIAFEPVRDRRHLPEIRGTLWVDRKTAELQRLEFTYTNLSRDLERSGASGDMEFVRTRGGHWVISRWAIRMPVIQSERVRMSSRSSATRLESWVSEIHVEGGELAMVRRGGDTLWTRPALTLTGTLLDSTSGAPLVASTVALRGTTLSAVSDVAGRFRINDAIPGDYTVEIRTPSLDSVDARYSVPFTFIDTTTTLRARVPAAAQMLAAVCGAAKIATPYDGVVTGTVRMAGDSAPPQHVKVTAEWTELGPDTGRRPGRSQWLETRTDAHGRFRICGVPTHTTVVLRSESPAGITAPLEIRLFSNQRFARLNMVLEKQIARGAVFTGLVLSDVNAQPVTDAEVTLRTYSKASYTNDRGAFRITGIPSGTHEVTVRHLGHKQVLMNVAFDDGQTVERNILLSRVIVLDTVAVTASPRDQLMRDFEDNRRIGLGKFWTRAELAKLEGMWMSGVLSQIGGSRVIRGRGNHAWLIRSRGVLSLDSAARSLIVPDLTDRQKGAPRACYATVWVDNTRVYSGMNHEPLFDLNSISAADIESMAYYASPAQTPGRYSNLNTVCGVLVILTRSR